MKIYEPLVLKSFRGLMSFKWFKHFRGYKNVCFFSLVLALRGFFARSTVNIFMSSGVDLS